MSLRVLILLLLQSETRCDLSSLLVTLSSADEESLLQFLPLPQPDQYTSAQRNLSSWSGSTYTSEWLAWSTNISSFLSLPVPFFQAGAMAMDPTPSALFTTSDLVQEEIDQGGSVRWFSQHMYQYSTCDPERNVLIGNVTTLVEHQK